MRISELTNITIKSQTINRKIENKPSQIVFCMRPLRDTKAGKRREREKKREGSFTHVEQARGYSVGEPLDGSRLTVNWLAD